MKSLLWLRGETGRAFKYFMKQKLALWVRMLLESQEGQRRHR